ncbi:unnamed protein product, partial [Ectocarpus sp. 12 AP-2014]
VRTTAAAKGWIVAADATTYVGYVHGRVLVGKEATFITARRKKMLYLVLLFSAAKEIDSPCLVPMSLRSCLPSCEAPVPFRLLGWAAGLPLATCEPSCHEEHAMTLRNHHFLWMPSARTFSPKFR